MTYRSVNAYIATVADLLNCEYTFNIFDDNSASAPPYIVFFYDGSNDFNADDQNYIKIRAVTIEFYSAFKDIDSETALESYLTENYIPYQKSENYISNEKTYQTTYSMEVIINAE